MAFLPDAVFGDAIFIGDEMVIISDLHELFGDSDELIVEMLPQRFDRLPIHKLVYSYQSYYQGVFRC